MQDQVAVALEEYRALRQEIQSSIASQHSILTFGTVAVSFLASAAFTQARDTDQAKPFLIALLIFGLPTLCFAVVAMWMNEVSRMLRAGWHLRSHLEPLINTLLGSTVLTWECKAHAVDQPDVEKNHFRLVSLVFGTLTVTFLSLGLYKLWRYGPSVRLHVFFTALCVLMSALFVWVGLRIRRDYLRLRAQWSVIRLASEQDVLEVWLPKARGARTLW